MCILTMAHRTLGALCPCQPQSYQSWHQLRLRRRFLPSLPSLPPPRHHHPLPHLHPQWRFPYQENLRGKYQTSEETGHSALETFLAPQSQNTLCITPESERAAFCIRDFRVQVPGREWGGRVSPHLPGCLHRPGHMKSCLAPDGTNRKGGLVPSFHSGGLHTPRLLLKGSISPHLLKTALCSISSLERKTKEEGRESCFT